MLGMPSRCYGFNKRSAEAQRTQKGKIGSWEICEVPGSVVPVVAIPDFISTQEARRVLPR